ncbi:MAG: hypothetical protein K2X93_24870 [Candidatus Obscuribacterales bacterium]|nr:hypothetical protein [Candidatus Obscuribacterales bacterium]
MLIDILLKSRKGGYLAKEMPGSLSFFSNNTLSIRRSILDEVGMYDEECQRSEDVEICARIARSRWMMFHSMDMIFQHRPRGSLKELMNQWWGYGKYVPYVFKKHNAGQWEIFYMRGDSSTQPLAPGLRYRKLLYLERMPLTMCIFITPFLTFHCALLALAFSIVSGEATISTIFGIVTLLSFFSYVKPDFAPGTPIVAALQLVVVRYLVNIAFFSAQLISGIRIGTLYIAPVISDRAQST